jgi:hypothetical protein
VQGDPAGVPAHDLDDQRTVVGLGRGVQPVDGLDRDRDRRVEAERVVGRAEIVVDRLGYADDRDALVGEAAGHAQRVLAADRDQSLDARVGERGPDLVDGALDLVRVRPGRAEDRAAARQDAADLIDPQRPVIAFHRSAPTVPEAYELVAVVADALTDDGPDDGVESGAVAPSGEHADTHGAVLSRGREVRWTRGCGWSDTPERTGRPGPSGVTASAHTVARRPEPIQTDGRSGPGRPCRLHDPPAGQVVPRVGEGVVLVGPG